MQIGVIARQLFYIKSLEIQPPYWGPLLSSFGGLQPLAVSKEPFGHKGDFAEQTNERTDGQTNGRTDESMDGRTDGQTDGWADNGLLEARYLQLYKII